MNPTLDKFLKILENPEEYPEEYEALLGYVDELMGYRKDDPLHPGPPGPEWLEEREGNSAKEDDGVWDLPPGWTEQSARDFWKNMGGSVTKCIEKLEDKEEITDAGGFCASLKTRVEGPAWRHEPRKSSTEDLLDFVYDTGRLLTTASLNDDDIEVFSNSICVAMEELEGRGAGEFGEQALEESGLL
jgi:hypothetical protein